MSSGDPTSKGRMMSVAEAQERILALAAPLGEETVPLTAACGRALRRDVVARRTQPPFDAAQMDGYAVALPEGGAAPAGTPFRLRGEARAGAAAEATLSPGEAVRIFTGAPMPAATQGTRLSIALQEDASQQGDVVSFSEAVGPEAWIRPAGLDFSEGDVLLTAPRRISPEDVALAAASGAPWLTVSRRPRAALLTLGDELRLPGETLGPSDIHASNQFGVAALLAKAGVEIVMPPVVPDDIASLSRVIEDVSGADLIVTLGGASDGDHDLARPAFAALGMAPDFYKIAMRPGKPLMAGRLGRALVLGLPGNPVSAMVCSRVFVLPALAALEGAPGLGEEWVELPLAETLGKGGPRAHYMRAVIEGRGAERRVRVYEDQDSSRLRLLSTADCLALRPANDPKRDEGARIPCLLLR